MKSVVPMKDSEGITAQSVLVKVCAKTKSESKPAHAGGPAFLRYSEAGLTHASINMWEGSYYTPDQSRLLCLFNMAELQLFSRLSKTKKRMFNQA